MKRFVCSVLWLSTTMFGADKAPQRPAITGFSHVAFYNASFEATDKFYRQTVGLDPGEWPGAYRVGRQRVESEPMPQMPPPNLLSHIAFATTDAEAMRDYLKAKGIAVPASIHEEKNGTRWFALNDPEGTPLEFVEEKAPAENNPKAVSSQIIHVGFVVRDRDKEDAFYRDILGFRLYWHGGMEEGHTDWIAMQVPEGRQWIEYMMTGRDAKPDAHQLGVLFHYSLGVADIHAAEKLLLSRGWTPSPPSRVQMGKDGKYQLNLYDPDGTRVELMEFTPKEKPCCAAFTAPHPE